MRRLASLFACMIMGVLASTSSADPGAPGSHQWRFHEVFSNADGTIQFIELRECCGYPNETFLANKDITAHNQPSVFIFTENLPCSDCTAFQSLLLATQTFADLPGAPAPDYIIPENFLSLTGAEELTYWLYPAAVMEWAAGDLPLDGMLSLSIDGVADVMSPTNFAGETWCHPADRNFDGTVNVLDLLTVLNAWGTCGAPCPGDIDGDGFVNVLDLLAVLGGWGDCR